MAGRKGRKAARMMEPAAIYPSAKKIPCLYLKAGQRREQQGWVTVNRDDPKFQTKQKFDSVSGERKPNWVDISFPEYCMPDATKVVFSVVVTLTVQCIMRNQLRVRRTKMVETAKRLGWKGGGGIGERATKCFRTTSVELQEI